MGWLSGQVFGFCLYQAEIIFPELLKKKGFLKQIFEELHMINERLDHLKYSVNIRFIRNIYTMYSVSFRYNPNTVNPYSVYKKTESE